MSLLKREFTSIPNPRIQELLWFQADRTRWAKAFSSWNSWALAAIPCLTVYTGKGLLPYRNLLVFFCLRLIFQCGEGDFLPQVQTLELASSMLYCSWDQWGMNKQSQRAFLWRLDRRLAMLSAPELLPLVLGQAGPHISKRHVSLHLLPERMREHTTRDFLLFIPATESSNCAYCQGPPVFSSSSFIPWSSSRGPLFWGLSGRRGAWSSLPKLHMEPTITTCCTQAGTRGIISRVDSEGHSPKYLQGCSMQRSLVWGKEVMIPWAKPSS